MTPAGSAGTGAARPSKPVRVGVVGYGYWGPNLVRNLDRLPDADLVCACDVNDGNLERLKAAYPHLDTSCDLGEMLSRFDVDAVVVASSAPSHFGLAKRALEAGKHVFVEKPLTLTSRDAEELVRLADDRRLTLMVGHLMEYHSAIEWIRDRIAAGDLGEVLYVYGQRLNLGKVRTEENAFWSLAPHDVSIVLYLLGESPDYVSANGAAYVTPGVQDTVFANLHFPSGKMANIHVSWLDPHKVRKFTIVGSKKMLVFDDMEATEKVWIYDKGVEPPEALPYGADLQLRFGEIRVPFIEMSEPLAKEVQHFLDRVTDGETPRSDGRDGLRVVRVLEAVDESMAAGGAPMSTTVEV
ncbi:MAG: Gfo/Idh/MocA family oxidoreductase [Coriobacteriia bacterium]|nr:Gfo/Idh/MocA family oxidoreductase [Coriobacteriia bacterium]